MQDEKKVTGESMILSIDGGTTNTRLYLVEKGSILSVKKLHIGIDTKIVRVLK